MSTIENEMQVIISLNSFLFYQIYFLTIKHMFLRCSTVGTIKAMFVTKNNVNESFYSQEAV